MGRQLHRDDVDRRTSSCPRGACNDTPDRPLQHAIGRGQPSAAPPCSRQGRSKPKARARESCMQGPSWSPPGYFGRPLGPSHAPRPALSGPAASADDRTLPIPSSLPAAFAIRTALMTSFSHSAMSVIASFGPKHQTARHHQPWNWASSPALIAARVQHLHPGTQYQYTQKKTHSSILNVTLLFLSTYKIYYATLVGSLVSEPSLAG